MSPIRILVVDDHDLFRRGLVEVLTEEPDVEVVGEARDGREAIERTAKLAPDVVCMDLNMPGRGGIEATAFVTQQWPQVKVLVLTVSEEPEDLYRALSVGALGYALKNARSGDIVDALRQVQHGWVVVSPAMASRLLADLRGDPGAPQKEGELSEIEQHILELVARGQTSADVARALSLTEQDVRTDIKQIVHKLHVRNQGEAAAYASRLHYLVEEIGSQVESAYHAMRDYLDDAGGRPSGATRR